MSERWTLKNDYLTVEVSEYGAELKKLEGKNGVNYIWYSDPKYWSYSAPFLWPTVGCLKDKKTYFNGVLYKHRQHGILRNQEFKLVSQKEDELSFENRYSSDTLKEYPFKYKATVTYKLAGKKLFTNIEIENLDSIDMPFNIGGHPAFNCPLYDGEKFSDYVIEFSEEESFDSPHVMPNATLDFSRIDARYRGLKTLNLNKNMFFLDTIINTKVKSKSVKLLNPKGLGIKFSFAGFKTFAIWTPFNDAPFVCLEPWNGYNDLVDSDKDFLKKADLIILKPNCKYQVGYTMEIID